MKKAGRRRSVNTRVIVGVFLVALSIVSVFGLMRFTSHKSTTLVATRLLVEGQQITATDVNQRSVQIDELSGQYLDTPQLAIGKVVMRSIAPGELIPRASLGEASEVIETSIVIEIDSPLASRLGPGSRVDVWATEDPSKAQSYDAASPAEPQLVVSRARLAQHVQSSGGFDAGVDRVEIVVDRQYIPVVLDVQSRGYSFHVVATRGGTFS